VVLLHQHCAASGIVVVFHLSQACLVLSKQRLLLFYLELFVNKRLLLVQSHVLRDGHIFVRLSLLHQLDFLAHQPLRVAQILEALDVLVLTDVILDEHFTSFLLVFGQRLPLQGCLLSALSVLLLFLVLQPASFGNLSDLKIAELLLSQHVVS